MIKLISCFLCAGIFYTACKSKNQSSSVAIQKTTSSDSITKPFNDIDTSISSLDDSLYHIIESLSEVKNFSKRYDLKKLDKNLRIEIAQRPDKSFPYFWIKVGVVDQYRFQPVYNFYITKDYRQILYLDTVNDDSLLTLKNWRRTRGW